MSAPKHLLAVPALVLGLLVLPAGPVLADTFGQHVRDCAQTMGFSGTHNPGMHRGAAGWDGKPC